MHPYTNLLMRTDHVYNLQWLMIGLMIGLKKVAANVIDQQLTYEPNIELIGKYGSTSYIGMTTKKNGGQ